MTCDFTEARYTTKQAAPALGLPFSSIDGVLRQLGFEPTIASRGSGRPRRWSLADIVAVKIGHGCVERGASWLTARMAMQQIKAAGSGGSSSVVVLCGLTVWVTCRESLSNHPPQKPVFVWDLRHCFAEVQQQLALASPEGVEPP